MIFLYGSNLECGSQFSAKGLVCCELSTKYQFGNWISGEF